MKRPATSPVFRAGLMVLLVAIAVYFVNRGANIVGGDATFVQRVRGPSLPHEMRGAAVLHGASPGPLCVAVHQRYEQCGKTKCWADKGALHLADGTVDIDGQSLVLTSSFAIEPESPAPRWAEPTTRADEIRERGASFPGFYAVSFSDGPTDRIVEWCAREGTKVYVATCTEEGHTTPCAGHSSWTVALGDGTPEVAVRAYVDQTYGWFAGALLALFFAAMTWLAPSTVLARALSSHVKTPGPRLAYAIGAALVLFAAVFASTPVEGRDDGPFTRGAYGYFGQTALAIAAGIVVLGIVLLAIRHRVVGRALAFVRATEARKLVDVDGEVAVFVRALVSANENEIVRSLVSDGEVVALSRATIHERHGSGKSSRLDVICPAADLPERISVEDDTGTAILDMRKAELDADTQRLTRKGLPENVKARFGALTEKQAHTEWVVEEDRIKPGEELFVVGEVTEGKNAPGDGGYRAMQRVPTLGSDVFPLVVYVGKRDDLLATLAKERRGGTLVLAMWFALLGSDLVASLVLRSL